MFRTLLKSGSANKQKPSTPCREERDLTRREPCIM
jgi:hypothetical protein